MPIRPALCATLLVVVACTAPPTEPPTAVRHTAVPVGPTGEVLAAHGVVLDVTSVEYGDDARAVLRIDGRVVAEERWVAGRYYQRSAATGALLGDDRWLSAPPERAAMIELGLRELARRGGRRVVERGGVVELVARQSSPVDAPAIDAPPPSEVIDLLDVIADGG